MNTARKTQPNPGGRRPPRKQPRARPRRSSLATVLKWSVIGSLAAAALGACAVATLLWHYGSDPSLPSIRSINDYQPRQVTRVAGSDGEVVGEIYTERRTYLPYEQIPQLLINGFISAEDADFFRHQGLDYWGMMRAAYINLRAGRAQQGASTITQQVVKTFFLTPARTMKRKIQEIILARRLEQALSKEEILALYLNQIYFGHGRYGVAEAARFYFDKTVPELNPGEAALIAGLPQAPENISPRKPANRERAKRRQQYVLEQMVHHGHLSEDEARKWINEPIRIVKDAFPHQGKAPEWVGVVRQELRKRYGAEQLPVLGGQVVTTMDLAVQAAAVTALRKGLRAYDKRHEYGRPVRRVKRDKIALEVAKLARRLPKGGPKPGTTYRAVVRAVHSADQELVVDFGKWKASLLWPEDDRTLTRYNPEGKPLDERFAAGDVIRVVRPMETPRGPQPKHTDRVVTLARGPEGAVVVIDPKTRAVRALVGGYRLAPGDFNRALRAKRQPGSTFKPLVYAAAIESGKYTAASIVNDAPEVYNLWKPQNYKKGAFEGPVRLRYALAKSINTVSIRVLHDIGPERAVDLASRLGISASLPEELSLALGSGEVTPLELTNAFATLAAGGVAAPTRFIDRFDIDVDPTAPEQPTAPVPVLSPDVAYVVTDMMTSVVQEGTARAAKRLNLPLAGKTGTSNDARDAWFIGMTPNYAVGVWIGFDDNRPLGRGESGGSTALPVYVELLRELMKKPVGRRERTARWAAPDNVRRVRIDSASGLLAPERADPDTVYTEVFIAGSEPTEYALAPDEVAPIDLVGQEYEDDYLGEADPEYGDDDSGDGDTNDAVIENRDGTTAEAGSNPGASAAGANRTAKRGPDVDL